MAKGGIAFLQITNNPLAKSEIQRFEYAMVSSCVITVPWYRHIPLLLGKKYSKLYSKAT